MTLKAYSPEFAQELEKRCASNWKAGANAGGIPGHGADPAREKSRAADAQTVLDVLPTGEGITRGEVLNLTGLSEHRIGSALARLLEEGKASREKRRFVKWRRICTPPSS